MAEVQSSAELENKKKKLFTFAMRGKWKDVIEMYKEDAGLHQAKITRSQDTALHIAASDGNEEVVTQMVDIVCTHQHGNPIEALQTQNERKNTVLHIAASMGNLRMCHLIANVDPSLVDIRNADGETPLFLAALHGKKQAFLLLHYIRNPPPRDELINKSAPFYANSRRNGGDTILHCAIAGDYFDLAFQIIHLYGELVNSVNEMGLSPLHLLAAKPSAFRSGSRLGRFQMIIYYCILVEELEVVQYDPKKCLTANKRRKTKQVPQNYQTCWDLFSVIKTAMDVATDKFPVAHYLKNKFAPKGGQPHSKAEDVEEATNSSTAVGGSKGRADERRVYPPNYRTCCNLFKFVYLVAMVFLGQGSRELKKIKRKKEQHTWCIQIMKELLGHASLYAYDDNGSQPEAEAPALPSDDRDATTPYAIDKSGNITRHSTSSPPPNNQSQSSGNLFIYIVLKNCGRKSKIETPILIAAKNGVTEMVEKILELFPVAIHDMNEEKKNLVLLAVESRQPHVYQLLLKRNILKESLFRKVDDEGNSALHLAAKLGDYKPWLIPGAALQMQWEIKWYEFVKQSMPPHFFVRYNNYNKTPRDLFRETHKEMVKSGGEWLNKTSESCSLVAALIATVAFATSATVPGGMNPEGHPVLERQAPFNLFAISSLIALCCSITAVVMFLSVLTSRFQEHDFGKDLPRKLLWGLTALFMSIVSMLVSFCAGHFFVLQDQLQYAALPIYAVTSLPVTLFALAQFPLYFDLVWATFKRVPQRSYKVTPTPLPLTSHHSTPPTPKPDRII
ncbi:serine/threonine-protein phosphatase 6 regulatory ankyrin repeat subunit B-like [Senna tora]|uniref:Serine/threonine-protein phosphatase 6 regulatory ankyrin repeat subunit B-like n=1 Tax=Senna tora TaxID=362788 RepID=A0A834TC27_9FABA|nr:serine/threonine-protein phosphatase 6 regulatory ankyrin repeat subunit B-like [Senna tora]